MSDVGLEWGAQYHSVRNVASYSDVGDDDDVIVILLGLSLCQCCHHFYMLLTGPSGVGLLIGACCIVFFLVF